MAQRRMDRALPRQSASSREAEPDRGRDRRGGGLRWGVALAALFAAALAWRLAYVWRLGASPLGDVLVSDARIYWGWADLLRGGDWIGSRPFFLAPLYPYSLGMLRGLVGDSIAGIRAVQAGWGALAVVLLTDATRRLSRPAIGIVVGALVAFQRQAVFFDGLLLGESLLFFLESLLVWWVASRDWRAAGTTAFATVGALTALIAEGRATHAALLIPFLASFLPASAAVGMRRLRLAGAALAGLALVATPAAVRSVAVVGEWMPFTYSAGYNLYVGNNPWADGAFTSITGTRAWGEIPAAAEGGTVLDGRAYLQATEGVTLGPGASSDHWAAKAARFAKEQPAHVVGLAMRKLGLLWNRREVPQVEFADEFDAIAGPLGIPWLGSFACLGSLGLAGLLLAWRLGPRHRFLAGYAVTLSLVTIPFFVTDRYRHHLLPALALLASVPLQRLWESWRRRDVARGIGVVASLVAATIVVNLPAPEAPPDAVAWRIASDLGARWLEHGRPDRAAAQFERALALESSGLPWLEDPAIVPERTVLYADYSVALSQLGRRPDAIHWLERAVDVAPDNVEAAYDLAGLYAANGQGAAVESLETRMISMPGGIGRALASRGWREVERGRLGIAESLFVQATRASPEIDDAWGILVRLRARSGRLTLAERTLDQARAAGMPVLRLRAHQALLAALRGDAAAAEGFLAAIPESTATRDRSVDEIVFFVRRLLARGR